MTIKAVMCVAYGPPETLQLMDVDPVPLGETEVRLEVHACGVNFPDTLIIEGKYQYKPEPPFSPGGEVSGVVTEVGGAVKGIKPGDRVLAMTSWGGYREEVVTDQSRVTLIPDGMDLVDAAGFLTTYGTSYYALVNRGQLQAGETLLVLGAAGGVGLAAVQIGKLLGATVIACASSQDKLDLCQQYGADHLINYAEAEFKEKVKELTGGRGADVIYDAVGGDAFDQAMRCINWNGRLLVIGFAAGRIPQLPVNLALLKGASVIGVFYGRFKQEEPAESQKVVDALLDWYRAGKIKPHIQVKLPLEKAVDALQMMAARKAQGKIMIVTRHYKG